MRGQPLNSGNGRRAGNNLHLGDGNLFSHLRLVAAIGKEPRIAARDGERSAGACKSREIAQIGQMGNQQAVKASFGQTAAQEAYAAKVVHVLRITGEEAEIRSQRSEIRSEALTE